MKKYTVLFVLTLGLLLAACGGGGPEVVEVQVVMDEYSFEPSTITVPEGAEVHLTMINNGTLEHELLIGKLAGMEFSEDYFDHDPSKVEASGGEGFHVGGAEEIAEEGYHVELEAGATGTLVFIAEKGGDWDIACFLEEGVHFEEGMVGSFVVE